MSRIMDIIKAESFDKELEECDGELRYYCKKQTEHINKNQQHKMKILGERD